MRQLATIMMFAAWLLYGAMPAMAVMPMAGAAMAGAAINAGPATSQHAMPVHSGHGDIAQSDPMHGEIQQPCPHKSEDGKKICVAPFCSACLVMPPHITFADSGRFIHRYPAPETGLSLIVSGPAPLTPPPRA
ncbi:MULTISPECIES: hypothetical protein [Rhizobiaceae]|uniref:DUF2946 domain-containing protein n=1 Tax=Aliirhizobium cellulosilyticum TaxID=393664 RepID=A0A7W6UY55_9HYPH|nr:hypothetical protein [Rhizobium cellulosilyticum]MBB4348558.1 hypothetical protein [Rhizobium cellulosilyticum]MBB4411794.1 hypothetical protein [Rhizobium cellulosilyticum]MBB4446485.1 hypothetical protein [Rhizobium cellulosilyticum]